MMVDTSRRMIPAADHNLRYAGWLVLAALLVAAVLLCRFSPRYDVWPTVFFPVQMEFPDVNRAFDTLPQLNDPFVEIENPSNKVIEWRLLPALVGWGLGLSPHVFFALPFLGVALTLGLLLWIFEQDTGDWLFAVAATVVTSTAGWFFVATGWLAHFDAWCVLGLLVVSFVRSRWALVGVCLLIPWVDERFVIALPLVLAIRAIRVHDFPTGNQGQALRDIGICAAIVGPYALIRLFAMSTGDEHSVRFFVEARERIARPLDMLQGAWHGLRFGWILVLLAIVVTWQRHHRRTAVGLLAIAAGTILFALAIAADYHRSVAIATPLVVLGAIRTHQSWPHWDRWILVGLAALTLLLPAKHYISTFSVPIRPLPVEIDRHDNPRLRMQPAWWHQRGTMLFRRGKQRQQPAALREAARCFMIARSLAPKEPIGHLNEAIVLMELGYRDQARRRLAVVESLPDRSGVDPELLAHIKAVLAPTTTQPDRVPLGPSGPSSAPPASGGEKDNGDPSFVGEDG